MSDINVLDCGDDCLTGVLHPFTFSAMACCCKC